MRPSHALITISALLAGSYLFATPAKADFKIESVSLRGTYGLDEAYADTALGNESEIAFFAFPLILDFTMGDDAWMHSSTSAPPRFSIWEKDEVLERNRPRKRFNPFGARDSFEIFGAHVFKSEVRLQFTGDDSLFSDSSALAIAWGKGAVAFQYESDVDLGYQWGSMQLGLKVEIAKEQTPELYVAQSPWQFETETRYLLYLKKKL